VARSGVGRHRYRRRPRPRVGRRSGDPRRGRRSSALARAGRPFLASTRAPCAVLLFAMRLVPAILAAVLLAACPGSHRPGDDPPGVLRAYARALEEGRAEDAYRMLSDEARRGISLEAFRRMVKDNPEEVREIGRALARPTAAPLVTATVSGPNGQ